MNVRKQSRSLFSRHKHLAVTLLEQLIVLAVFNTAFLGYLLIAERSMNTAAWGRDATLALTLAQNELEWWQSAPAQARASLKTGEHPFANPTASISPTSYVTKLYVEPIDEKLVKLRAVVLRDGSNVPVRVEVETLLLIQEDNKR